MAMLEPGIAVEKPGDLGVETGDVGRDAFERRLSSAWRKDVAAAARRFCSATPSALAA